MAKELGNKSMKMKQKQSFLCNRFLQKVARNDVVSVRTSKNTARKGKKDLKFQSCTHNTHTTENSIQMSPHFEFVIIDLVIEKLPKCMIQSSLHKSCTHCYIMYFCFYFNNKLAFI